MDDGHPDHSGFILNTNSFTLEELQLLANALKKSILVNCSVHNRKDRGNKSHLIYIKADSWEKFKSLIEPHVIPPFAYKLVRRRSSTSG
jgi:hypothetical protein